MDRRTALLGLVAALAGCGGGGGSASPAPALAAAPPAAAQGPLAAPPPPGPPAVTLSSNIALWGDSLTDGTSEIPGYSVQLRRIYPSRIVYDGGVWGETSTSITRRVLADRDRRTWVTVFWMGRNNLADPEQVKADIAAAVAHLGGNARFIVMSIINSSDETRGTARHATMTQLNADLASTYHDNFLDVRGHLVDQFDPNSPQDVAAHANDVVPPSLSQDGLHLNGAGYAVVANRVKAFMDAKGW
ncbi:SGNH/GDSL hydrolase family protein [Ramlibacter henchirensis]|uniref:SGNH/GDSL hydrolase family protein n=1 Tax=Ramlibacter henchirensis TaxID=204072 RepID=A0A4Z0BMS2_9BURK|nr:SGNH/GDSL hydrolase family protein [Ramlibacter henchirensis]TFZ00606.1 SGNH/GDSL hydrolase family protein [Ramlibacter henchirensis]